MKKIVALVCASVLFAHAQATELITNGGFETGNLTAWTTSGLTVPGSCGGGLNAVDWTVSNVGTATQCTDPGNPVQGTYAAYNMFDAGAPLTYRLRQTIQIPVNTVQGTLRWSDSISYSVTGLPRVFSIRILDAAGTATLATLYTNSVVGSGATGWIAHTQDATSALSALSGQTVMIEFAVDIQQVWTGPAGMGLDAVSLDVTAVTPVPTLSTYGIIGLMLALAMFGIGVARRRSALR